MNVTAVILTFNEEQHLARCIASEWFGTAANLAAG
jgi:hypothetical protein